MLGTCKSSKVSRAPQRSRGSRKQHGAALALHHALSHRLPGEKRRKTSHFPNLKILTWRFFQNRTGHISAHIKDKYHNGPHGGFKGIYQLIDLGFVAGIAAKTYCLATSGADGLH